MQGKQQEPLTLVHECVEHFINEHFAEEVPFFSTIWDDFKSNISRLDLQDGLPQSAGISTQVGLAFSARQRIKLAAPLAIMAVYSTLLECQAEGIVPSLLQVESAIRSCAKELRAPKALREKIVKNLAPVIMAQCAVLEGKTQTSYSATDSLESGKTNREFFHSEWLLEGSLEKERLAQEDIGAFLEEHRFDIVVDERKDEYSVSIWKADKGATAKHPLQQISRGRRIMLWIVLSNAGKAIHYDAISERLENTISGNDEDRANRIHGHRSRLKALIGENLASRIFGVASGRRYSIKKKQWSYCWIRPVSNIEESELLL